MKKLPASQVMAHVTRLRSQNNRYWSILWLEGLKTKRGQQAWRSIQRTDLKVNRWMRRVKI